MKILKISFVLLLLVACGGGGGSDDGSTPQSCAATNNASPVCTPEFLADYGLDLIGANAVYDEGYPITDREGERTVVAVLDTGIDVDHPEFAGRIHSESMNFNPLMPASGGTNTGNRPYPEFREFDDPGYQAGKRFEQTDYIGHYCDTDCGHGTTVASVVAAARDGVGGQLHGVAYNAEILVLKSDFVDPDNNNEPYAPGLPAAIAHAITHGAVAVNISAGGRAFSEYDMAMRTTRIEVADVEETEIQMINGVEQEVTIIDRRYITKQLEDMPEQIPGVSVGEISLALARAAQNDVAIVFATGNSSGRGLTPEQRKEQMIDGGEFEPTEYPPTLAGARTTDCDNPANVPRLGGFCDPAVRTALEGMRGYDAAEGPYRGLIIGVAAVDANREVAIFSSLCDTMNPRYCLAAPGQDIRVAFPGGVYEITESRTNPDGSMDTRTTNTVDGTSFAAPYVTGAIALLRSTFPVLSSKQAVRIILETADDVGGCSIPGASGFDCFNHDYGNGILNLRRALGPAGDLRLTTHYRTREFLGNWGLNIIGADAIYPIRGTGAGKGAGVIAAVLDTGIDRDHPAFRGRIHAASRNFYTQGGATSQDYDHDEAPDCNEACDHGTQVAGIIAAAKDGVGMHGVAYQTEILALKSTLVVKNVIPNEEDELEAFPHAAGVVEAIDHAIAQDAVVINISGSGFEFEDFDEGMSRLTMNLDGTWTVGTTATRDSSITTQGGITLALARAAADDIAVVFSTGNDSERDQPSRTRAQTIYPTPLAGATFSDCDGGTKQARLGGFCDSGVRRTLENMDGYNAAEGPFRGLILGVASIGRRTDDRADYRAVSSFSSLCDVMDPRYCLAAPGFGIYTTADGGGYTPDAGGTSFAAPHVAGAIALLRSTFSELTSKQAVQILLASADDVGACSVPGAVGFECFNDDYGNGILNLEAALGPLGDLGFRTQSGEAGGKKRTGRSGGFLSLSSATLSLPMAFGDALGRDSSLGRIIAYDDYQRGYVINLAPRVNRQGFESALESILSFDSFEQEVGQTSLRLGRFSLTTQFSMNHGEDTGDAEQNSLASVHFSAELEGATVGLATGSSSRHLTLGFYGEALQVLGITHLSPSPYAHLIQNGAGITIDSHFENWALSYGLRQGDSASSKEALAFDVKAERSFESGIYLGGLVSVIAEQNSFLAASGRGAFKATSGTTQSLTLGMGYARGNTRIFGQVSGGQTEIKSTGGILSDFSLIKTSAALVGGSKEKVFSNTDRFDIVLSRPLKVSSASATLNADVSGATGLTPSGTSRVSLAPSGQQTNLELTYTNVFSKTTTLSLGLALINQPAHNAAAKNERALALRWVKHF